MMGTFPVDAPRDRVVATLRSLGFRLVREREHLAMARDNPDGTTIPLTLPSPSERQRVDAPTHRHPSRDLACRFPGRLRAGAVSTTPLATLSDLPSSHR
jgi:hypothetical protein